MAAKDKRIGIKQNTGYQHSWMMTYTNARDLMNSMRPQKQVWICIYLRCCQLTLTWSHSFLLCTVVTGLFVTNVRIILLRCRLLSLF